MTPVNNFGIHRAPGDIAFLMQKGPTQCLYPGIPSPFNVKRRAGARSCPHAVDLAIADSAGSEIFEDPLARWFSDPTPLAVIHDPERQLVPVISLLDQLYSPVRTNTAVAWTLQGRFWMEEVMVTNLNPFTVFDVGSSHMPNVSHLASGVPIRPSLLVTKETIPIPRSAVRLETDLTEADLQGLLLQQLGAYSVINRMLRAPATASH